MNRSFRAPEKEMPAPVKQRQQQTTGSFRNSREKEEEPGLFLEMKKREKERHDLLLQTAESEFDSSLGSRTESYPVFSMPSATTVRKTGADEFLNSENDKNDYDWLLTPPGTPLFPSLETESQKTVMNPNGAHKPHPTAVKSTLSNAQQDSTATARNNLASRPRAASPGPSAGSRRLSSTGSVGPGFRSSSLTTRPGLGTQSRAIPISNTVTKNIPTSTTTVRPRSSTPTSRPVLSSSKPTGPARSSTPTSRSTARSSTPTSRPSLSATKPAPRTPTPPRRSPTLSTVTKTSIKSPSNVTNSPNARPRPWKPQEMPGYTLDTPPNLRTSLTDRPNPSVRGRAGAPSSRSSSIEPVPGGRVRRQSMSPSRGRLPNGVNRKSGGSVPVPALLRAYAKANDNMSPGLYGTQMVERVVNMRKLVPPKQDDKHSPNSNISGKSSSSPDSSGFGRSLSKKSLDMAMRHMDIRRAIPGNLRPLMTRIPASSMYSVRSEATRNHRMNNVSDSPVATSSNASSETSVNNNTINEHIDEDSTSEKGVRSPSTIRLSMEGDEYTDCAVENVVGEVLITIFVRVLLIKDVYAFTEIEISVKLEFQRSVDEIVEAMDQDENLSDMIAESYEQKKSYIKSHIMELSQLHNSMADDYADLIEEVSKNCPSLFQNLHVKSSESSSSPQVTQTVAPNFSTATGFNVLLQPGGCGFYLSRVEESSHSGFGYSMSSVNKPPVAPVSDDALKVKETKDSGLDSSISSVNKPVVPPVSDDPLKVEETKDSGSESSLSSVNKTPEPPVNDEALNVEETKDCGSDSEALKVEETKDSSSESFISKLPVTPVKDDDDLKLEESQDTKAFCSDFDALKIEETKDTGSESDALKVEETKNSASESSIPKPPVPPVNDDDLKLEETKVFCSDFDALKIEETKDAGSESDASKVGETKDSGSESSMSSVNKPEVPSDSDDALKAEETKEHEVLLEKVSSLEEEVASLKQKVKSLIEENGELKQENEENIKDIGLYMTASKQETKALEEDLQASNKFAKTIDELMCMLLAEKSSNEAKRDHEINEMKKKMSQYVNEISQLKSAYEKKEKIWNGVTAKLKDDINSKCEMVEVLSKNIEALIQDKSSQNKIIHQLKTELESVKFENARVVVKQVEAMSERDAK
ncbi:hypothetical protein SSX86_018224 [Deinandra increscens subsp. villosa]|uniref:Uncharacterized protein n=1 Tax=Deinandra increscens subsp. villosa TaxID=3103831 RepID=A0AAP0CXF7_9ASTR